MLHLNCTAFSQSESSDFFMCIIRAKIEWFPPLIKFNSNKHNQQLQTFPQESHFQVVVLILNFELINLFSARITPEKFGKGAFSFTLKTHILRFLSTLSLRKTREEGIKFSIETTSFLKSSVFKTFSVRAKTQSGVFNFFQF